MKHIKAKHLHMFECPICSYILMFTWEPENAQTACPHCCKPLSLTEENEIEIYDY